MSGQTMRAAKLFGAGDIRVVTCDIPDISDDEILLRTAAAAICGSDLRMIGNGYKGVDPDHPLTLGHEFAGVIESVGASVQGYSTGMRVSVAPNMGCGVCDHCVRGDTHLCASYRAFGINMDGAFAEYIRIPVDAIRQGNIAILDDSLSADVAACVEPMSCVVNGQQLTGIHRNDVVLVIGAGPIGVMHAKLAMASGAARVLVYDLSAQRMEQCAALVANCTAVTGNGLKESVMALTRGQGVDVCIIACPSPEMQALSLELMRMNGRILYFGGLPADKDMVSIPTNLIHYRQLSIHGSTRANVSQYRESLEMASSGLLDLSAIITGRFRIEQFRDAVQHMRSAAGLKAVIIFE
jgi:L-iditol 2-dehydrogenase